MNPTTPSTDMLVSMALQIPIVIAFIWFVLKLMREFLSYLKVHDGEWKQFFEQMTARWSKEQDARDIQWRSFLEKEQQRSIEGYRYVANQLKEMSIKVDCLMDDHQRRSAKKQGE